MSDTKLRCALVYRLESTGSTGGGDSGTGDGIALSNLSNCTLLAKYDHASDYENSGGSALYGDREKNYAEAVGMVVGNDPPASVGEEGVLGGFKVVQSDMHQVIYGADSEGLCECTYNNIVVVLFYFICCTHTYMRVLIFILGESVSS